MSVLIYYERDGEAAARFTGGRQQKGSRERLIRVDRWLGWVRDCGFALVLALS